MSIAFSYVYGVTQQSAGLSSRTMCILAVARVMDEKKKANRWPLRSCNYLIMVPHGSCYLTRHSPPYPPQPHYTFIYGFILFMLLYMQPGRYLHLLYNLLLLVYQYIYSRQTMLECCGLRWPVTAAGPKYMATGAGRAAVIGYLGLGPSIRSYQYLVV